MATQNYDFLLKRTEINTHYTSTLSCDADLQRTGKRNEAGNALGLNTQTTVLLLNNLGHWLQLGSLALISSDSWAPISWSGCTIVDLDEMPKPQMLLV